MKVKLKSECTCRATSARDSCTETMMRIETIKKKRCHHRSIFRKLKINAKKIK
jgi:hypothetical protein